MQKMFLAMLAAALLWGTAAKADETVEMDGRSYPTCAAAEPDAYGNDGKLKLAFVENCPENARQMSARPASAAPAAYASSASADYRSFGDVAKELAADSLSVTEGGRTFRARSLGGGNAACEPPRMKHRKDQQGNESCSATPDGRGVRCRMYCY